MSTNRRAFLGQASLAAAYYYLQRSPASNQELIAACLPYIADLATQT